jgi:multimeric flavodoxin WrbA
MKVAIINGSPKPSGSASQLLAEELRNRLGNIECVTTSPIGQDRSKILEKLDGSNALALVLPLYVDGLPSELLRFLDESLHDISTRASGAKVYAIANNGFFEGRQNVVAFEILRNFTSRAGLQWGQAIGVGGGGMLRSARIGHGPLKNLGKGLDALAQNILNARTAQDLMLEPNFPRSLYIAIAHLSWRLEARKNGVKGKRMYAKS